MAQNFNIGELGQLLTVDAVSNNITFAANSIVIGNASSNSVVNSTSFSGTANNALTANNSTNLGGAAASAYVNTSGNYTVAGNLNFTGTNNYFTSNTYFGNSTVRSTINQYTQSIINLTLMGY